MLCQLYREQHNGDKTNLMQYLESVGIQTRWTKKIADWVHEKHLEAGSDRPIRPVTFCVEGNIGAGKSTWLDMVKQSASRGARLTGQLQELIEVVPEPVGTWQDVGGENLLEAFYNDPTRYAYTFQSYVFVTRLLQENQSRSLPASVRLLERSVFCDRMVFVKAVHEAQHMSQLELKLYDSWFNPMLQMNPHLMPDGFVYLQTSPETCMRRLRKRNRSEEGGIAGDYLSRLSSFHESWLVEGSTRLDSLGGRAGVVRLGNGRTVVRTDSTLFPAAEGEPTDLAGVRLGVTPLEQSQAVPHLVIPELPDALKGSVVLLDGARLNQDTANTTAVSNLHLVPALHVDCDEDIDVNDPDVMAARADMMSKYRAWVSDYQQENRALLSSLRATALAGLGTDAASMEAAERLMRLQQRGGSLEALGKVLA